jgi:hypothetical protein
MPIKKYMSGAVFDPETIKVMIVAFNGVQVILNLGNPDDPLIEIVAEKVISLASQGCLDPAEITRRVVADTDRPLRDSRARAGRGAAVNDPPTTW